jgi:hypothetical protein
LWFDYLLIFLEILNFIVLIRKILVVIAYHIVSFLKFVLFPIIVDNSWRIYGRP